MMSEVFLALATVGILLLGYLLAGKLDRFLNEHPFQDVQEHPDTPCALVFADATRTAQVAEALEPYQAQVRRIDSATPPGNMERCAILAASDSDPDNILLCVQAVKTHAAHCVALCNHPQYRFVYQDYGIEQVAQSPNEAIELFVRCIKEWTENND